MRPLRHPLSIIHYPLSIVLSWLALAAALPAQPSPGPATRLVAAARAQIGVTTLYDPAYVALDYPGGDVPPDRGVCTDVIVRAYRVGLGLDLQKLLHADMKSNFARYPKNWGLARPDRNIDHRRVPNLRRYFERQGASLPLSDPPDPTKFLPGDLVTCIVPKNLPHIMLVTNTISETDPNRFQVIHNIGSGARLEDRLLEFPLTGHYRFLPASKPNPASD